MKVNELRPCIVDDKVARFHCWTQEAEIHRAVLKGDVSGVIATTMAIIEFTDGSVQLRNPRDVKFCDTTTERMEEWHRNGAVKE